jgi:hypothetical protein
MACQERSRVLRSSLWHAKKGLGLRDGGTGMPIMPIMQHWRASARDVEGLWLKSLACQKGLRLGLERFCHWHARNAMNKLASDVSPND